MSGTIKVLIAAMGGEGGGLLCRWLTRLGEANGRAVHYTYIPGAAQRTGATTYYLEIHGGDPKEGRRPLSTLIPSPGDIDLVLSTEIVEAGRCLMRGFITPAKTTVISSTHRTYAIAEKSARGDGRIEHAALLPSLQERSRRFIGFDMATCAARAGTVINGVLFGAVAASGVLPLAREAFLEAMGGGPYRKANEEAFALGFEGSALDPPALAKTPNTAHGVAIPDTIPESIRDVVTEGVARTAEYQSSAYAELYLERVQRIVELESRLVGGGAATELSRESARWLIRLMCYDDVARVAHLKSRRRRFERIRSTVRLEPREVLYIQDFLTPGAREMADMMPAPLGRAFLRYLGHTRLGRLGASIELRANTVLGFLLLRLLAALRVLRPYSLRYGDENERIERWLDAICEAAERSCAMAIEVAGLARLIKGYGPTHCRGEQSFRAVFSRWQQTKSPGELRRMKDAALTEERGSALPRAMAVASSAHSVEARMTEGGVP